MSKKGFTLVELLSTIVILGVLAVITVPVFNIYIESSRVGVVKTSATSYIKQIEYELSTDEATSSPSYFGDFTDKNLDVFGDKPSLVEVEIVNNAVDNGIIVYGDYGVIINNRSVVEVVKGRLFLSINGDSTTYVEVATPYVEKGATAIDLIDGTITPNIITTGTVNTNMIGTYTITYSITNSGGQTTTKNRTVKVIDNDPPVITIIGGNDIVHQIGTIYNDSGATATDTLNGNLTTSITKVSTVNPNVKGDYTVIYTVKDSSGNTSTATRKVTVVDSFAPTITIIGSNPYNMTPGVYTELGATATDTLDGNITANIDIISDVNPTMFGVYTVIYSVTDSSGNNATATRTVNVNDATLPTVTFGTMTNTSYGLSRNTTVTVTDLDSGVNANSLEYQWTQSTTAPLEPTFTTSFASGATIPTPALATGDWYLWILAKDNSANTRITRTDVFKLDNTIPTISFSLNGNTTYALSHSTNVTVTDSHSGVNTDTLKYQWTTTSVQPTDTSFNQSFTNGASFTTPNVTGDHYLWILARDGLGNLRVLGTTVFKVDVSGPLVAFGTNGISTPAKSASTTVTVSDALAGVSATTLKYQWTQSTTAPLEPTFTTTFTSGNTITTPANQNGDWYLWILAKDTIGNLSILPSSVFKLDNTVVSITFSPLGNNTYAKSHSTIVAVSDTNSGVDASSLKYQWTQSLTAPLEATFSTSFVSGNSITTPANQNGTWYLWILAKDKAANTDRIKSNGFNLDNTAPIITILGNNPYNMFVGATYNEAWVTATDNIDGDLTDEVEDLSNLNVYMANTYTVRYDVSDSAGNPAIQAVRTINVTDSTPPTVTFGTNGNETWAQTGSTTVTVTDAESGVNASTLRYLWTNSSIAPTATDFTNSGTAFTSGNTITSPSNLNGDWYLWIHAKDIANNGPPTHPPVGTNRFRLDNTGPVLSITGANPYAITVGDTFVEPGRSATDALSGLSSLTNTTIPTASGTYTITYTAIDNATNRSQGTRGLYIWSAYSATTQGTYNGVRTRLEQRSRTITSVLVNTGEQYSDGGYPACVSCSSQWWACITPGVGPCGDTGIAVNNTRFYRANCTQWGTNYGTWGSYSVVGSCSADTSTVDYDCITTYSYR